MKRVVLRCALCLIGWSVRISAAGQSPALTATFDSALQAPKCAMVGRSCDSGPSLLLGRDSKGPEPNQPNTIGDSCADGTQGVFHVDESIDRLAVSTIDGTSFKAGKTVKIEATVWAWTTPSNDHLDLYYAAVAASPIWTFLGTINPISVGAQTLSATYILPDSSLQAVRAQFRYQGLSSPCSEAGYNDRDDLVFAVMGTAAPTDVMATFDPTLQVPKCNGVGRSCDSGPSLLVGRDHVGPEPNEPNTIMDSCADGVSGVFHSDESNDRIKVSTVDGSALSAGKTVKVEATVWAWSTPSSDHLDLYFASNANAPTWTYVATLNPTVAGPQTLSATYTLPRGSLQAVRVRYRYLGLPGSCNTGSFDDHDDLAFAVQ
jgi:hypothetical protein